MKMKPNSKQHNLIIRDDLNYLNMEEIKSLCKTFNLPFQIHYEDENGKIKRTSEVERKPYLLDRIYNFIQGKKSQKPIIYSKKIVKMGPFKTKYLPTDFILYGDFKSTNKLLINLLKFLSDQKFKFGAIAFIVAHELWRKNKRVTLEDFAKKWVKADKNHTAPLKEWAYLTDLQNGFTQSEWKKFRKNKAEKMMKDLLEINS